MRALPIRLAVALLAVAATSAVSPAGDAQAKVLEHRSTGFSAHAPADFSVLLRPSTGTYVVLSRKRGLTLSYRRVRGNRSPRAVRNLLASQLGGPVTRRQVGRRAFRAVTADGDVLQVRRSTRRALTVVRFSRPAWAGRQDLLATILRSLRGGRTAKLPARRQRPAQPPATGPRRGAPGASKPAPVVASSGEVLFRSGFDAGTFAGWYVQSLPSRATIVPGGAHGSSHAARFEVRDGDVEPDTGSERSEISLSNPKFNEGQEIYIRDTFLVPANSSIGSSWQIINQIHETNWGGSPGLAVFLQRGPAITIGAGDGSPTFLDSHPIQHDRWHDLIYHVKFSQNPAIGYIEAWLDGTPLRLTNGQHRMHQQTIQAPSGYLKAGIYRGRSHTGTSTIYHDNLTAATSLTAAQGQ